MTSFQLPIYYNNNKKPLNNQIDSDLELSVLYENIFNSTNNFGSLTQNMWKVNYTSDKNFLKDTQQLLKTKLPEFKNDNSNLLNLWKKINTDENLGFHAKYQYIEWDKLYFLNKNSDFLQLISIYNLSSPIISLCIPIIFLIIPFLILRIQGINMNFKNYYDILIVLFKKHQLGQLFNLSSVSWDKRIYIY